MPQKKNPDAAELLRAKAPRVRRTSPGLHGVLHGLPLTYNKDLQEDKERLFDAVDTLELTIAAATEMLRGISFNRERMAEAAADEFPAATDIADLLVRRGVPFRQAHGIVAGLVRYAIGNGKAPVELSEDEVRDMRGARAGYHELLAEGAWLESKVSEGGTSLARVREQIERARRGAGGGARFEPGSPTTARCNDVARDLVGCTVRHADAAGRIVEVESYHMEEPACHAFVA